AAALAPRVRITADDLNGLPDGTAVAVDADLNGDGLFTGTGESGYAGGTLSAGYVDLTLPAFAAARPYPPPAPLSDRAGNEGTSATVSATVSTVGTAWTITADVRSHDPEDGSPEENIGDVTAGQPLDLDRSPGTRQSGGTTLVYHSDTVSVRPIVQAQVQADNATALPPTITAQLTWDGTAQTAQTYSTSGLNKGDLINVAQQVSS